MPSPAEHSEGVCRHHSGDTKGHQISWGRAQGQVLTDSTGFSLVVVPFPCPITNSCVVIYCTVYLSARSEPGGYRATEWGGDREMCEGALSQGGSWWLPGVPRGLSVAPNPCPQFCPKWRAKAPTEHSATRSLWSGERQDRTPCPMSEVLSWLPHVIRTLPPQAAPVSPAGKGHLRIRAPPKWPRPRDLHFHFPPGAQEGSDSAGG